MSGDGSGSLPDLAHCFLLRQTCAEYVATCTGQHVTTH